MNSLGMRLDASVAHLILHVDDSPQKHLLKLSDQIICSLFPIPYPL